MEIKKGYNGKTTSIKISTQDNGSIEFWIEETGREGSKETLAYLDPVELLELYQEVKRAGLDLFN